MPTPSEIASKHLDVRTAAGQRLKKDIEDAVAAERSAWAGRVEMLEGLLRECLSDYSHPRFTDRHRMADRIRAALEYRSRP